MSEDKLELILEMQEELDDMIAAKYGLLYPQYIDQEEEAEAHEQILQAWIHQSCVAMMVELAEVQEAAQYKWWKAYDVPIDIAHVKEELIDVAFFWFGLWIKLGGTAEELMNAYQIKYKENLDRQNGKSKQKDYSK